MRQYCILRFIFVPGLTAIFVTGGLRVEDKQNNLHVFNLCWFGPTRKFTDQNQEAKGEVEQKNSRQFSRSFH